MKYTLRQLEVFLATAHTENISRAAENLAMSQSAASSALKDLESQFDIQLFDRSGKKLQLNELGRLLQPRAEELLERARELEMAMGKHTQSGPLKVGATLTIGNYLAVNLLARYMEDEHARASLEVANTATITRKVREFELDVGLIEGEIQHPDLAVSRWREDELVVFCAANHPYAKLKKLTDQQLVDATWILREQGSGTRQTFDRAMHGLLPELNVLLELQHTEAIKRAVEAELGIGCLSRITLNDAIAQKRLVPLAIPNRDFSRHFYLILHREKYRGAGLSRWLTLCESSQ
jgi:DNA-binding transcriptional LysR family regulator